MSANSALVIGRIDSSLVTGQGTVVFDAPEQTTKAIITKLDQIIAWQTAVGAAITTATDGPSLYAALNTATVKAAIGALRFTL